MTKKSNFFLFIIICLCLINFAGAFIKDKGIEGIVDYEKYGYFENLNTNEYKYTLLDRKGLGDAQGESIYPNGWSIFSNPGYKEAKNKGLLEGNRWDFTHIDNPELMYYKWIDSFQESPGLRQFFIAEALQKGGYIKHAIKAYYSILVFFPKETGNTYWKTPWYVGSVALDRIYFLLDNHKDIDWTLEGTNLIIKNRFDDNLENDVFLVNPGKFTIKRYDQYRKINDKISNENIEKFGNISLTRNKNDNWQLKIDNKPYFIKGVAYSPVVKGEEINNENFQDWSCMDENRNNKIDAPYESVVDGKVVGDFKLMKNMGVNTIRIYADIANKKVLNSLFNDFGIRVMIGIPFDFLRQADLNDEYFLNNQDIKSILNVVKKHKDEPYLFCWILGNEDNFYINSNQKENYYRAVNQIAKIIKNVDKNHPVVVCNGDLLYLDCFAKECPYVDIFGINVYRGGYGIGYSFWNDLKIYWDRPVLIIEYGCTAFSNINLKDGEKKQLDYHENCWEDIKYNSYGNLEGVGLSIGGVAFEWVDEWWKAGTPAYQDESAQWAGPFPDGWMYEEFLGICGQGNKRDNKLTRKPRQVYYFYKKEWK